MLLLQCDACTHMPVWWLLTIIFIPSSQRLCPCHTQNKWQQMKTHTDIQQTHHHKSEDPEHGSTTRTLRGSLLPVRLSPSLKSNLCRVQPSQWDACICVYFSAHISILGHVRLISPKPSAPGSQNHLAAFILKPLHFRLSKLKHNTDKLRIIPPVFEIAEKSIWSRVLRPVCNQQGLLIWETNPASDFEGNLKQKRVYVFAKAQTT